MSGPEKLPDANRILPHAPDHGVLPFRPEPPPDEEGPPPTDPIPPKPGDEDGQ